MFACNGILFNHESPRRGETFVTRKITRYSEKSVWLIRCLFSASGVIYKSYRQVLTPVPVNNLKRLLRLPIFDKTRLVAFHKTMTNDTKKLHKLIFTC
jgi:GDP-mannose 4,6 dehydratase